jgi:hypothetical protein
MRRVLYQIHVFVLAHDVKLIVGQLGDLNAGCIERSQIKLFVLLKKLLRRTYKVGKSALHSRSERESECTSWMSQHARVQILHECMHAPTCTCLAITSILFPPKIVSKI